MTPERLQRDRIRASLLALALFIPTAANCIVGTPTWWAPIPVWTFILRMMILPWPVVALLPGVLFLVLAFPAGSAGRVRRRLILTCVASSWLTHLGWLAWLFHQGAVLPGMAHAVFVVTAGSLLLAIATRQAIVGTKAADDRRLAAAAWLVALWAGWMGVPWFMEAM